jgi:hypothetical protein
MLTDIPPSPSLRRNNKYQHGIYLIIINYRPPIVHTTPHREIQFSFFRGYFIFFRWAFKSLPDENLSALSDI